MTQRIDSFEFNSTCAQMVPFRLIIVDVAGGAAHSLSAPHHRPGGLATQIHAAVGHELDRVDLRVRGTPRSAGPNLEVQMRSCDLSGGSDVADDLAGVNVLAGGHDGL